MFDIKNGKTTIVDFGDVGLSLAIEFGKHYPSIGLDTKAERSGNFRLGSTAHGR